ncbi:hypothetical protein RJ639_004708 [Escallonia herrerae]|uniref:Uncharacterized protein n=1 Tax=Escallonia herrerae TaxID=1293975 RepID=A0AA88W335_9ASTE|nr:hypothetical protein RJ639_004708 [Escallonia herrerae]
MPSLSPSNLLALAAVTHLRVVQHVRFQPKLGRKVILQPVISLSTQSMKTGNYVTNSGRIPMASHNFELIEEIDETEALIDYDILDTHGGLGETRVDDVCDLLRCDNEVRTPRENEAYEIFDSQQIDGKTFDTPEAAYEFYNQYALLNGFGTCKHNAHKIRAIIIFRR